MTGPISNWHRRTSMAFPTHPAGLGGVPSAPPQGGMGLGPMGAGAPGPSISQMLAGLASQHGAPMSLTAHPGGGGGPHMGGGGGPPPLPHVATGPGLGGAGPPPGIGGPVPGGGGGPPPAMPPGGLGPPPGVRPPMGGGGPPPMAGPPVGARPRAPRGGPQGGIKIKPAPVRVS